MDKQKNISDTGLAIIAGRGDLPRLLAEHCQASNQNYTVVEFENVPLHWSEGHPVINAVLEKIGPLFDQLRDASCTNIVMAGAMDRRGFDVSKLDAKGAELAYMLATAMKAGDDETLGAIIKFFEDNGFRVSAAHEVLPSLISQSGVLTNAKPNDDDAFDAARAAEIVDGLGKMDVGQGAVVAQGICLGLESIQGTDTMLSFVKGSREDYIPNSKGGKGVLLKAPKSGQDLRVDLPAIGPNTVQNAFNAGLAGVVVEAGGVMILQQEETVSLANDLGIFLWVRPNG